MKNLLTYLLFMMTTICSADDTSYWAALRESLRMADSAYCMMTYQNLANCCDRIIRLYENDWLPRYYKAYACTHLGFMTGDEADKDLMYDVAQESLEAAIRINPDESENHVLQALICYGRMEINPMVRATVYYPKANAALEKAKELNPGNPRIYYLEGKSTLYKPDFLGGGTEAAIPILEKALECYTKFEAPYAVYPYWGEEATRALFNTCVEEIKEKKPCSYTQKKYNGINQKHPVETLYLSGIDAFNSHEVETFLQQFADDAEMYTNNGWCRGLSCIKERFTYIFQQFPSIKMEITDLQVREVIKGTAVIDFNWKVFPNGCDPAWSGVGSGVYILRNNRWMEVLEHETLVHSDEELNLSGK